MIVKIQIPLFSNKNNPPALVYNKDRSLYEYIEVTEELKKRMNGNAKAYFSVRGNGKPLEIVGRVEDQSW